MMTSHCINRSRSPRHAASNNRIRIRVPKNHVYTPYHPEDPWNLDNNNLMPATTSTSTSTSHTHCTTNTVSPPLSIPTAAAPPAPPFIVASHQRELHESESRTAPPPPPPPPPYRSSASSFVVTELQLSAWRDDQSEDPYIRLPNHLVNHIQPQMNIWIKYHNTATQRLLPGGVLIKNGSPNYIMLRNPLTGIVFSVQLIHADLYARRSRLSPLGSRRR